MVPVNEWDTLGRKWTVIEVELSDSDEGKTVMAKWLGKSVSKTTGCSFGDTM